MNHDYAHCLDFRDDCPKSCFRAQLVRDLMANPELRGIWVSYTHFKGTGECKKENDKS